MAHEIDLMIELAVSNLPPDEIITDHCHKKLVHRAGALIYSRNSVLATKKDLSLDDFAKETFLVPNSRDYQLHADNSLTNIRQLGISNPRIEYSDNFTSMISDVVLGNGYCLLSRTVADQNADLLAFPVPDEFGADIYAVWMSSNKLACALMDD